MSYVATFEKVSEEQFLKDCFALGITGETREEIDRTLPLLKAAYKQIQLPTRATAGSVGYDFYCPVYSIIKNKPVTIPTGIRCIMEDTHFLMLVPRSGLGFKYGLRLHNTVGIIDSDYQFADNEGHIMVRLTAQKDYPIKQGERFVQGILLPTAFATNDEDHPPKAIRKGGIGSTGVGSTGETTEPEDSEENNP